MSWMAPEQTSTLLPGETGQRDESCRNADKTAVGFGAPDVWKSSRRRASSTRHRGPSTASPCRVFANVGNARFPSFIQCKHLCGPSNKDVGSSTNEGGWSLFVFVANEMEETHVNHR